MKGNLFIISAPSGSGKSSISHMACSTKEVSLSISYTTRQPRTKEREGVSYFFIDEPTFLQMRDRKEFLECALVHDNWYGTSRSWVESQLAMGRDILLEIDWKGARQVREKMPDAVTIFVLPPSRNHLKMRLQKRAQDDVDVIEKRIGRAPEEIAHASEYDYAIVNRDLQESIDKFLMIVRASRQRYISAKDEVAAVMEDFEKHE